MEYVRLGRSGLRVSRLGLGCMSYGQAAAGMHQWTLDEDAAAPFFRQAVELGVTFWDTANSYQGGTSEEFVGRAINRYARREDIVLATKVYGKMHDGPGGGGLSRKAILEQLDASLRRLGTDYLDVYYIHRFDDQVPVEETMEVLHDVVRAGKVRYLGASSMWAWQFAKLQTRRRAGRLDHVLRDAGPVQRAQARGGAGHDPALPRPGRRADAVLAAGQGPGDPSLGSSRPLGRPRDAVAKAFDREADQPVVDAVERIAEAPWRPDGAGRARLGAVEAGRVLPDRRRDQAQATSHDAVAALDIKLTEDETHALEDPYTAQDNYWW